MVSMMAMRCVCWLLAAAPALVWQCAAQVVEGTVSSSLGGAPIGGVSVTLEQGGKTAYQANTDGAGVFRIEAVKDGNYTARFSQREFQAPARDAAARRPFRVVAGGEPVRLQVQMTPRGKVSGRVLDGEGHPMPGAEVEL